MGSITQTSKYLATSSFWSILELIILSITSPYHLRPHTILPLKKPPQSNKSFKNVYLSKTRKGRSYPNPTDSNSGISTGVPQGSGLRKHPKATETEATEAEKARETSRKLVAKKLGAIQKLAELSLEAEAPGTKKARKATTRYISTALDIYDVLGPEFEAVITLKVIRGIESKSLKETVATMMWDKDWKLHNIANILRASAEYVTFVYS
ncbi:hypothetical protein TWF192_007294 [Orbilia oligospora]|nr:hypothetical protein TWF192_007294 [Orbilia oligospora]